MHEPRMIPVTVTLPPALLRRVVLQAKRLHGRRGVSRFVRVALERALAATSN